MSSNEGKYNIKAVAKMVGIQPGTLRAWERRYQMIAPVRKESGHRLYTEDHIKILQWLVQKVNNGVTISQAVALLEKDNPDLLESSQLDTWENQDLSNELIEQLLQALIAFDDSKAREVMDELFSLYSVEKVLVAIAQLLISKLLTLRENGHITRAQEHFATAFLRSRIGILLHGHSCNNDIHKVISVCGPGESHEIVLLASTVFAGRKGLETIYLGASISNQDLERVIQELKPSLLFLTCTFSDNLSNTLDLVEQLQLMHPDLNIGLSGVAIDKMPAHQKQLFNKFLLGTTLKEWECWLQRYMKGKSFA